MNLPFLLGGLLLGIRPAPVAAALKKILRLKRREVVTSDGVFWVDPGSNTGQRIWREGSYEAASSALLKRLLRPGDTFIDIGANEGCITVPGARLVSPTGRAVAVEPQLRLHEVLRRNFSRNSVNVELVCAALSDRCAEGHLHLTPDINNSASGLSKQTRYTLRTQSVPLLTLEALFRQLGIKDRVIMKMDIEGFEHEAILGSPALFQEHRIVALLLELHPAYISRRGLDLDAVSHFLAACGYRHLPNSDGHVWALPDFNR